MTYFQMYSKDIEMGRNPSTGLLVLDVVSTGHRMINVRRA